MSRTEFVPFQNNYRNPVLFRQRLAFPQHTAHTRQSWSLVCSCWRRCRARDMRESKARLNAKGSLIQVCQKGLDYSMSGSKRPSASVVSFRNNVEEDFTVRPLARFASALPPNIVFKYLVRACSLNQLVHELRSFSWCDARIKPMCGMWKNDTQISTRFTGGCRYAAESTHAAAMSISRPVTLAGASRLRF
jgi:hypothetical protein